MKYCVMVFVILLFVPVFALRGEQVLKFEAIEIKGRVQKPQVTYILPRSGLLKIGVNIDDLKPDLVKDVWSNLDLEKDEQFR